MSSGTREFRQCEILGEEVGEYDERASTCEHFKEWEEWQVKLILPED